MNNRRRSVIIANEESGGGIPRNGLIAEYLFNDNANDTSGNSYDLTPSDLTYGAGPGGITKCAVFNGSSSKAVAASRIIPSNNIFSISYWVNPATDGTGNRFIMGFSMASFYSNILNLYQYTDRLQWYHYLGSGSVDGVADGSYSQNVFTHYVLTYNNGVMNLYKNNTFIATYTSAVSAIQSNAIFSVGYDATNFSFAPYFKGEEAAIRIYDRILSSDEINALYEEGLDPPAPDFSTASWSEIQEYINENGTNGFADQVGATRSITLTDSSTHTLRLANATGNLYELSDGSAYTGFVVEFVDCIQTSAWSSGNNNIGPLGSVDPIGTTTLPAIELLLPSDLQNVLTEVKVISAKSGSENTLVSSNMKVFIPAMKELYGGVTSTGMTYTEANANSIVQWKYYELNNTATSRIKKYSDAATFWWTRSPLRNGSSVLMINAYGNAGDLGSTSNQGVSPCFCI